MHVSCNTTNKSVDTMPWYVDSGELECSSSNIFPGAHKATWGETEGVAAKSCWGRQKARRALS